MAYGYIYITENLVDGKKYIGQHRWENPGIDTKYYGSGKYLCRAIKKYGKENFKVSLIQYCNSRRELDTCERFWILYFNAVESPEFYNLKNGGIGGCVSGKNHPNYGKRRPKEVGIAISKALKGKYVRRKCWSLWS